MPVSYVLAHAPPVFKPGTPLSDEDVVATADELRRLLPIKGTADLTVQLKAQLAAEFGRRRGWVLKEDAYGAQHLFGKRPQWGKRDFPPCMDHPCGFRQGRQPMAIVSQPYPSPGHILAMQEWADSRRLVLTIPNYPSWWYPGWTSLCVFTREHIL